MELGWIGCASKLVDHKGSKDFPYTFSMALYHKWDVKNGFVYVLQFFSLISDGLDCVQCPFYIGTLILLFSKFSLSPYYCIIDTLGMYIFMSFEVQN